MSGKEVDVRVVPHGKDWAVKLTGGYGNKPVKVTGSLPDALETARGVARKYQVPILIFDAEGSFVRKDSWNR